LYAYLVYLGSVLQSRGSEQLCDVVARASRLGRGMSTEFLGESRMALRRVADEERGLLSRAERTVLLEILRQLDAAFDNR